MYINLILLCYFILFYFITLKCLSSLFHLFFVFLVFSKEKLAVAGL